MPKYRVIYDPVLKETPEWQSLYYRYRNNKIEGFADFLAFYNWSMENGFVMGSRLVRFDESKPYSQSNCQWMPPKEKDPQAFYGNEIRKSIAKYNEAVNRIRIHYGLEPFTQEGDSHTDENLL